MAGAKKTRGGRAARYKQVAFTTKKEAVDWMSSRGIQTAPALAKMPEELYLETMSSVANLLQEYPIINQVGMLKKLKTSRAEDASASYNTSYYPSTGDYVPESGALAFANSSYRSPETLRLDYELDVIGKFHPAGTTYRDIPYHEGGHAVHNALAIAKYGANISSRDKMSRDILGRAEKTLGHSISDADILSISRYASKNTSELIAEATASYHANGSKAPALARAIHRAIKAEEKLLQKKQ